MKDLQKYQLLLQKFMMNPSSITDDDISFFVSFTPQINEEKLREITKEGYETGRFTQEQFNEALQGLSALTLASPAHKNKMLDLYQTKKAGKIAGDVRNVLNTALAAVDTGVGMKQIAESRREARRLRRPERPVPLAAESRLTQALDEAQGGNIQAAKRLAPAQSTLLDSYLADINNAQTASTGQAGSFGAMAQTAATRRGKRAMELGSMSNQISNEANARYDDLLRMKIAENQAIQRSAGEYYPTEMNQYNNDLQRIGDLGSIGRSNVRAAIPSLLQGAPDMTAERMVRKKLNDIYNKMSIYGNQPAQTAVDATMKAWQGYQTPEERQPIDYTLLVEGLGGYRY